MNEASEIRSILVESATRLFTDHVDQRLLDNAKAQHFPSDLWQTVKDAQLHLISVPEKAGGAGGSIADLASVLRLAGRFCVPLPLSETAIAAWMLAECRLPIPEGPLAFGPVHGERIVARKESGRWMLSGSMKRVPWARVATHLVLLADGDDGNVVACIDSTRCRIRSGHNLAAEPRDDVVLDDVAVPLDAVASIATTVTDTNMKLRGALSRSLLTAGALERALELSVRYATERVQFGRKIGQFQAIQQELARFAGEVAASVASSLSAARTFDRDSDAILTVGSAKIRTAQAAHEGALIAHQVHGAMGVTDECALHHSTLRLWSWREEFGNETYWARILGRTLLARNAEGLWPSLTSI